MADLDDLIRTLNARVESALDDVALAIRAKARAGAPRRSGRLRRSIEVTRVSRAERSVGSPLSYAEFIETKDGFLADAVRDVSPKIASIFSEALS